MALVAVHSRCVAPTSRGRLVGIAPRWRRRRCCNSGCHGRGLSQKGRGPLVAAGQYRHPALEVLQRQRRESNSPSQSHGQVALGVSLQGTRPRAWPIPNQRGRIPGQLPAYLIVSASCSIQSADFRLCCLVVTKWASLAPPSPCRHTTARHARSASYWCSSMLMAYANAALCIYNFRNAPAGNSARPCSWHCPRPHI